MNAEVCMLIAGTGSFLLTLYWLRSRDLREKYAVCWLLVAFILFLAGLFPGVIMVIADASKLSYPAAVLFIALAVIYGFAFSVSASLTRHHRASRRLLQEVALLEERLRRLEAAREGASRRHRAPGIEETEATDATPLDTCVEA